MTELKIAPKSAGSLGEEHIPPVSIGMPVYNGEKYIREALNSLLVQTFDDFEIIISDNASTDKTQQICEEYASNDSRIKYIRQKENNGANVNFEFVLKEAKGRFFMWAAYDDRWLPTCLAQMVEVLEHDESCGLVFSNFIERDLESGKEVLHHVLPSNSKSQLLNYILRIRNMCPSMIYGLYRIDCIRNTKFEIFDFADVHFIIELMFRTQIHVIDEYLYIAGTAGYREPYSFTHKKINRVIFLRKQYALLKTQFYFPVTQCLFFLVCLVMAYNKIKLWRY